MNEVKHPWASALIFLFGRNIVTALGAVMSTVSFVALLIVGVLSLSIQAPYMSLLTFILLPGLAVFGLLLIPAGVVLDRILGRTNGRGPLKDFVTGANSPLIRRTLLMVFILTVINVVGVSAISYESVEYMSSVEFCGEACHEPMEPEFVAHQYWHHSKITCVDCHVGPGAEWFLKSKIAGVQRLLGVTTDEFARPIQPPSYEMRHALETCGNCHNPNRNVGEVLVVNTRYGEDEANTPNYTALYMRVGGALQGDRSIHGFHLSPGRKIYFLPPESNGDSVAYVRTAEADGSVRHYAPNAETQEFENIPLEKLHRMDCTSCHNRPAHTFELPAAAVDKAMATNLIPRNLPYIKTKTVEALVKAAETGNKDDIAAFINAYYAQNYPSLTDEQRADVEKAVSAANDIFARNVFPGMNVTWGTYPNHLGHVDTPGCFRCHDDQHQSADGRIIAQDCAVCHEVIAWNEEANDFVTMLNIANRP